MKEDLKNQGKHENRKWKQQRKRFIDIYKISQ